MVCTGFSRIDFLLVVDLNAIRKLNSKQIKYTSCYIAQLTFLVDAIRTIIVTTIAFKKKEREKRIVTTMMHAKEKEQNLLYLQMPILQIR